MHENAHYLLLFFFFLVTSRLTAALLSGYTPDAGQRVSEKHALKFWTDVTLNNHCRVEETGPFIDVGEQRIPFVCVIIKTRLGRS